MSRVPSAEEFVIDCAVRNGIRDAKSQLSWLNSMIGSRLGIGNFSKYEYTDRQLLTSSQLSGARVAFKAAKAAAAELNRENNPELFQELEKIEQQLAGIEEKIRNRKRNWIDKL